VAHQHSEARKLDKADARIVDGQGGLPPLHQPRSTQHAQKLGKPQQPHQPHGPELVNPRLFIRLVKDGENIHRHHADDIDDQPRAGVVTQDAVVAKHPLPSASMLIRQEELEKDVENKKNVDDAVEPEARPHVRLEESHLVGREDAHEHQ